jgi:Ceramidase
MNWFEPVRAYCERNGPEFWAEPANAVTNAAFLAAAALAARRASATDPVDRPCLGLAALIAVVGVGSFLFHTLAVSWSMLADVIPIALFIYAYLAVALRRFIRLAPIRIAAVTAGFALFGFALRTGRSITSRPFSPCSGWIGRQAGDRRSGSSAPAGG